MRSLRLLFLLPLALLTLSASSCQTNAAKANPFLECHTVGQCYLATTGTFSSAQDAALQVALNANTPPSVKAAIKTASSTGTMATAELSKSYTLYKHVKADLNACATDDASCKADANQKIVNATADVNKWLAEATPIVNDLLKLGAGD